MVHKMGRARRIEDELEETLSLIDLPITPIRREDENENQNRACFKTEDDDEEQSCEFDFGSTRFEMSSADELFLHGQILPLRLSVDSRMPRVVNSSRPDSASGASSVEFTTSRSSSYSSSTSSVNANNVAKTTKYQPKIRNQFHAYPSPTPRLPVSSNVGKTGFGRCRKSSVWDVFRLGPVQPPRIELKDLKTRNHGNPSHILKTQKCKGQNDKQRDQKTTLKQKMLGLGNVNVGCRCTAEAVENVQTRIVVMKIGERRRSDFRKGEIEEEFKKKIEEERRRRRRRRREQQGEELLPGRRTFEWLKQLSVEGDVNRDLEVKYFD